MQVPCDNWSSTPSFSTLQSLSAFVHSPTTPTCIHLRVYLWYPPYPWSCKCCCRLSLLSSFVWNLFAFSSPCSWCHGVRWTDNPEKISSLPSPFPASAGGINFSELAAEQLSCPDVLRLHNTKTLKLVTVMVQGKPLICDSNTKVLLPLVPSTYRFKIFSTLHCLLHPNIRATRHIISSQFVWRGLANDVWDYCRSCLPCQQCFGSISFWFGSGSGSEVTFDSVHRIFPIKCYARL